MENQLPDKQQQLQALTRCLSLLDAIDIKGSSSALMAEVQATIQQTAAIIKQELEIEQEHIKEQEDARMEKIAKSGSSS